MSLPSYLLVDNAETWNSCLEHLRGADRFALDIESNSLYVYLERVCLLQLSVGEVDYIVDPLAEFSLEGLESVLADPAKEKILHASEYDLILLKREFGWNVTNLFDTMWAARILGYSNMGLAYFLEALYGVKLSKRYQKADWGARPLTAGQLEYAQNDTHYLIRLRDALEEELETKGLAGEAREIFAGLCHVQLPDRSFNPEGFWSIRGARELSPRSLAILKELHLLRDAEAKQRNLPPFKVLGNTALVLLAETAPANRKDLLNVRGISPRTPERVQTKLLKAIAAGQQAPPPGKPARKPRSSPEVAERYERLHTWRKQRAQNRGVESDVIVSREALWSIAHSNPLTLGELGKNAALGPHRLHLYGEEILDQLSG